MADEQLGGTSPGVPTSTSPTSSWGWSALFAVGFLLWTALVVTARGPIRLDAAVLDAAVAARRPWMTAYAQVATQVGTSQALAPVALGVAALALWRGRRWLVAALMIIVLPVSDHLVEMIKLVTGRDRPSITLVLGPPALDPSFPSGHATSAAAVLGLAAVVLARQSATRVSRLIWLGSAGLLGILVGLSRIYLGYHWTSDVIGGWLLAGALVSAGAATIHRHDPASTAWRGTIPIPAPAPAPARAPASGPRGGIGVDQGVQRVGRSR